MIRPKQKRNRESREMDDEGIEVGKADGLQDEVDALFKLPLAEFTSARNDLAARLKREGRANDSNFVKALAKPSISAWAVNQLHWNHREASSGCSQPVNAFDNLRLRTLQRRWPTCVDRSTREAQPSLTCRI